MKIFAHRILTPDGFLSDRTIHIENGVVLGIGTAECGDLQCDIAAPGLIDQHVHGGFGIDLMHADADQILQWLRAIARKGVTQVLAGIYTYPIPMMRTALEAVRQAMDAQSKGAGGARLAGVHLEGPFISSKALGAMSLENILAPTLENYRRLTQGYENLIRLVTLAPEVSGAQELTAALNARGIAVEAGHTAATAEQGRAAFQNGIRGITHFFNASTPIHHRAPGILTEALLDDQVYCECICDQVHVHPSAIRLIHRCKGAGRMIVITDAVFTTGLPDGEYESLEDHYKVCSGESRTLDGALAGGGAELLDAVRGLIKLGIPAEDALYMASQTPADFLHISGGRIVPGRRAEIVCMDNQYRAQHTIIGEQIIGGTTE